MRYILIFLGLLAFSAPVFADSISDYCLTTKDPHGCMTSFLDDQARHNRLLRQDAQQAAINAQLEQSRIQANGFAMMGAGAAMINGMNQHLQNLQQPRYSTPAPTIQPYAPVNRAPIQCLSQTYGANMPAVTCY